ncbi:hypothetical protein [Streptomyces antibioticus]|uniref:hypothetical protein n=1 Tax=Streptomyces antibioticus TaxID=1890 RepID=UPI0033F870D4
MHVHQKFGNGFRLPVLMESGTFALDPEPWGPPWHRGEESEVVIAPGDVRGTRFVPERGGGCCCCGFSSADGPTMACGACGLLVATRIDDRSLWQAVQLAPDAVDRLPVGEPVPPLSWEELTATAKPTPPIEPLLPLWGGYRLGTNAFWSWSPQWEAAAGRALVHLLVASQGRPVIVPDGLTGEVFQRSLDVLLPKGPPARHAVLAGPGLPTPASDRHADVLLVPAHPQTGDVWAPVGPPDSAYPVPLSFGMWLWLAFPPPRLPAPVSGRMPDIVLRDEAPAPHPVRLFRADEGVFRDTLARLPAASRQPPAASRQPSAMDARDPREPHAGRDRPRLLDDRQHLVGHVCDLARRP